MLAAIWHSLEHPGLICKPRLVNVELVEHRSSQDKRNKAARQYVHDKHLHDVVCVMLMVIMLSEQCLSVH